MRKVVAFLVWLFSFWTWKDFFLRWLGSPRSPAASARAPPAAAELLPSPGKERESEFSRLLSSVPEDDRSWWRLHFWEDTRVTVHFHGVRQYEFRHGADVEAGHRYSELLEAAASSQFLGSGRLHLELEGTASCKHVEALAEVFRQSTRRLRVLFFEHDDCIQIRVARCLSSVLLGQDGIEELLFHWNTLTPLEELGEDVVAEVMTNIRPLRRLKLFHIRCPSGSGDAMEKLLEQLLELFKDPQSVLEHFSVDGDVQLEHISDLLATTTSLKSLTLHFPLFCEKRPRTRGFSSIAAALASNQSLQTLHCELCASEELKALLEPLMRKDNNLQGNTTLTKLKDNNLQGNTTLTKLKDNNLQGNTTLTKLKDNNLQGNTTLTKLKDSNLQGNTTLTKLKVWGELGGKEGIETLADMIRTNTSLLELYVVYLKEFQSDALEGMENVLIILEALKVNKSLKEISFEGGRAVGGYKVLGGMMDLLLENDSIEGIGLRGTGLNESGDAEYVHSALKKRRKMKMRSVVRGMTNAKPTFGRVFLCGEPYAGKTRLRTTMKTLQEFETQDEIPSSSRLKRWYDQNFKRTKAPNKTNDEKFLDRTHGIEVDNVQCDGIGISIWDMAGQTDYHSFHELVIPNISADGSSSLFMLMCNPVERSHPFCAHNRSSIREELETWLRFIASNTRRSLAYRPHVSIVMTHYDYWMEDATLAKCIEDVVNDLKSQFQEVLEFDEDKVVFKVDSTNRSYVRGVFDFIKSHLKQLLERLPKTLSACQEVQQHVAKWNLDKANPSLLTWDEFCQTMCKDVEELKDGDDEVAKGKKEFVAVSLNDGGHIIYNEKEGVVVTNPHWFCHSIMGEFLHQCVSKGLKLDMVSSNGIISHSDAKHFLENLFQGQEVVEKKLDDMLGMMMKLHVCYEQDANHIMIPSTLIAKHNTLSWCKHDGSSIFHYVGKRLACKDGKKTMLTFGFFTRLQVLFFKKLQSKNIQGTYQLFRDVIKFFNGGIEVILQFVEGDIDILLRSHLSQGKMIDLLDNFIVLHIKHLQTDLTLGCPGVLLEEYILRPACVCYLVPPKARKNQCVGMGELEFEVVKNGGEAIYNWKPCEGLDAGFDEVKTLLGDLAWKNLLKKHSLDLQECQRKIDCLGVSSKVDPPMCDNKKGESSSILRWRSPQAFIFGHLNEKFDDLQRRQNEIRRVQDEHHMEVMVKLDHIERGIKKIQGELLTQVCSRIDDVMAFSMETRNSQIPKLAYLCEVGEKKFLTRLVPGLVNVQVHLMCESIHGFHIVPNQKGYTENFATQDTKTFLAMISWGLKIATIFIKVGAHVACGMGAMIPDFSDGVSYGTLVLDSSGVLDYRVPTWSLEPLPVHAKKFSTIPTNDILEAQRWLRDFLKSKCQKETDFYEKIGLSKVKYHGSRGPIAWICNECVLNHQDEFDAWT